MIIDHCSELSIPVSVLSTFLLQRWEEGFAGNRRNEDVEHTPTLPSSSITLSTLPCCGLDSISCSIFTAPTPVLPVFFNQLKHGLMAYVYTYYVDCVKSVFELTSNVESSCSDTTGGPFLVCSCNTPVREWLKIDGKRMKETTQSQRRNLNINSPKSLPLDANLSEQ